jgi:hypothetical protein
MMSRHRPRARLISPQLFIALVVVAAMAALFALSSALRDRSTAGALGSNAANTGGLPALATVGSPGQPSWQPAPAVVAAPPVTVAPPPAPASPAAKHVAEVVKHHPAAPVVTGVVAIPDVAGHNTVLVAATLPAGAAPSSHSTAPAGPVTKAATPSPVVRTTAPVLTAPVVRAPVVTAVSSKPVVAAVVTPFEPVPAKKSSTPRHAPTLFTPVTGVLSLVSTVLNTVLGGHPHGH